MALPPRFGPPPYPVNRNEPPNNAVWNYQRNEIQQNNLDKTFQNQGCNSHVPPNNFSMPPPSYNINNSNNNNSNRPTLHPSPLQLQPATVMNMNRPPPPFNVYRAPIPLNVNRPPPPLPDSSNQFNLPHFQQGFLSNNTHHSDFHPPPLSFGASQPPSDMILPSPNTFNLNNQNHSFSHKQPSSRVQSHQNLLHRDKISDINLPSKPLTFDTEIEKKRKIGEQHLNSWLQKIGKAKKKINSVKIEKSHSDIKINDYLCKLQNFMGLIASLSNQVDTLEGLISSADKSSWLKEYDAMEMLQTKHKSLQNVIEKATVEQMKKKLAGSRHKRARLKRSHHLRHQEKQEVEEARQVKDNEISDWQQKRLSLMKEDLLKKKRKEDMDQTLGDVTKKINDANRLIETMTGLEKLRLIRQDAAKKRGDNDIGESRQSFEQKIADMTRLVRSQLEVYKEEEQQLRKIIKSEHEESSKKEKQLQEKKDQEEQEQKDEDLRKMLFGFSEDARVSDPLFPYQQFYKQAETSLPAFVQIRHEWDQYIVPSDSPNGTTIPHGWIHPCEPTSSAWASALK